MSHKNPNQKGLDGLGLAKVHVFVNLKALLIVLILILALIYVILIELRHFE